MNRINKALTLTIVIPAYNEENYIFDCLKAIESQTVKPDEVIVVDNNSTDLTADIVKHFPFVKLIYEKRQGLFFSRECGFDAAKSDIICKIDSDTVVDPEWVSNVKATFNDGKISSLTGPVGYHDFIFPRFFRFLEDIFLRIARRLNYNFLLGCNLAIRREVWQLVRGQVCNERFLFEDIDLNLHLNEIGYNASYSPDMRAFVSARRAADKPRDFYRYIKGHSRTLKYHGKRVFGAYFAELVFGIFYVTHRLPYLAFDPEARRFSLARLRNTQKARPDPMAVEAE